tara:strand:+ start:25629 stop:27875 length:2247 start_codon:yes stop_codon:yes gene_type:complete
MNISAGERVGNWTLCASEDKLLLTEAAARIVGRPDVREVSVLDFLDFVHPEDRARFKAALSQVLKTFSQDVHYRVLLPDGSQRIIQQIGAASGDTVQGIIQDITLREHQIHKLMRENQELAEAQTIAQIGRWELDLVYNQLHWSSGIFEMFEIDPEKFAASYEAFLETIHPDDRDRVDKAYTDSLKNLEPYEIKHRLLFSDGRVKWVKEKCRTTFDRNNRPLRSTGIVQDITEQMNNELQLRKMETFLERTSHVAGIGGWEVDLENDNLFWSEVTHRIHEVPVDFHPTIENAIEFYANEESRSLIRTSVEAVIERKESFRHELPLRTYTGRFIWVETRGEGEWSDGKCKRVFGTFQDITARKELEEQRLREHRLALDQNKAKTEFLSNLSHELRTPLNAVLGFAQLLRRNCPPEGTIHGLDEILKAGEYMQGLLEDVLDLSRVESRDLDFTISRIPAAELIRKCIRLSASLKSEKGIQITFQEPTEEVWILGDTLRSQQSLLNILSNAIKYNRDQGTVAIALKKTTDERVQISVTDTGPGIPEEKQYKLFQPFQRLGMESSGIEGTGIGLVLARNLLRLMGGELYFNSVPDKGTTFYLEFPLARNQSPEQERDFNREILKSRNPENIQGRILYIEDNPVNMRLMEHVILSFPGIELLTATTGHQGLSIARENSIDLFLLDLRLPDLNGFEIVQELRKWPQYKDTPAICVSADAMETEITEAINAGFDDYLTKPLNLEDLQSSLSNYLR